MEAIVKLGKLLHQAVAFSNATSYKIDCKNIIVVTHNIAIDELLRIIIQPIRFYAKEDSLVLFQLIKSLNFVMQNPNISIDNKKSIENELQNFRKDITYNIKNEADKKMVLSAFLS
jgi:uncharacterized membrane protein